MTGEVDTIGDLLRQFYGNYGVAEEGPPPGLNVSELIGSAGIAGADLEVIRGALSDAMAMRQFRECREVLDDLATRLTGEELLKELVGVPLPTKDGVQQLSSGVFWFALAASLDARERGLPVTPLDRTLNLPLPMKIQMTVHGSLVLRLYVALVYMREGVLNDMINVSARACGRCSARVRKLLNSDYVRRIRNALSHGSFSACIAGIVFRDDDGVIVATPGFLNWLCTWLMLIQLQALAAGAREPHVA